MTTVYILWDNVLGLAHDRPNKTRKLSPKMEYIFGPKKAYCSNWLPCVALLYHIYSLMNLKPKMKPQNQHNRDEEEQELELDLSLTIIAPISGTVTGNIAGATAALFFFLCGIPLALA